jgi:hypothetical protein
MSSALQPYAVLDDRLHIVDSLPFGVLHGAQSINQQKFTANSKSPNNITFNCLIPNLQTVIDRHIMIRNVIEFTVTTAVAPANLGTILTGMGDLNLANFPFSQCVNTLTLSINNTTVSSSYADTLDLILKQMSVEGLNKYSDLCPTHPDIYNNATTLTGSQSQYLTALNGLYDTRNFPRGAFPCKVLNIARTDATNTAASVVITVETWEPIFISPLTFGDALDGHNSGLSGISSMNFNFNLNGVVNKAIRIGLANAVVNSASVAITNVITSELHFSFLNPKPEQQIPLTCITPYYEIPIYKTPFNGTYANGASMSQLQSSVISPNTIPDKIYIWVRPQLSNIKVNKNDTFFPVTRVNITWGTQSGLLNSASQSELYYMSKKSGLKSSWLEFSGGINLTPNATGGIYTTIPYCGAMVVIDTATQLPLLESFYAPSSLGNFTFSVQVDAINQTGADVTGVELCVGFMNSGLFQSTAGSSSQYIGVLDKQTVLNTNTDPMSETEVNRLVGGGWLSSLKSALPAIKSVASYLAPSAKKYLSGKDSNVAQLASKALGMAGYGRVRQ